jgi:hypothetical integral membrane protein (TIGR02206 family)
MNPLRLFFDPRLHSSERFALGSAGHLALIAAMFGLLGLLVFFRRELAPLRGRRGLMAGAAAFVLGLELLSYALKFAYDVQPAWERAPLQLCSSLKLVITALILFGRTDRVRHLSVLAMGCGFISFVNLNLGGEGFGNFAFWHYVIGHLYLFLLPAFLFLTGGLKYELKTHLQMCLGLLAWSLTVFFINWGLDTNYMYSGPHNEVRVPFLPDVMMQWPMNYVSYVLIALVLLNGTFGLLRLSQRQGTQSSPPPIVSPPGGNITPCLDLESPQSSPSSSPA